MFGAHRLRWNVKVKHAAIADKHWAWIEGEGPWHLSTQKPTFDYEDDEIEDDEVSEYLGVSPEPPHVCPTYQVLYLRATPDDRARAVFDVTNFHFGSYLIRLTAKDRPSKKSGRLPREVELEITPDLSGAVAELLGAEEHPHHERDDEVMAQLAKYRRPR